MGAAELPDARDALNEMRRAQVLVSTGSSFALSAASLARAGTQIHIAFPPKENFYFRKNHSATPPADPSWCVTRSPTRGALEGDHQNLLPTAHEPEPWDALLPILSASPMMIEEYTCGG